MRITPQIQTYRNTYYTPVFKGAAEDFGRQIGDVFCKNIITPKQKLSLIELFKKALSEIQQSDRILGKGFRGTVYKIDENFAVKIRNLPAKKFREIQDIKAGSGKFKNLETYYGEPVGFLGDMKILRNFGTHIPAGVPENMIKSLASSKTPEDYYRSVYLPAFAKVPQESYDAVARDFARLNKMPPEDGEYFSFDGVNPNNVVLKEGKLALTDEIDTVIRPETNTFGKLLNIFLYRMTRLKTAAGYGAHKTDAFEILKKLVIASEKTELPYDSLEKDCIVIENVMKNFGISTDIVQDLEVIRYKYPELETRLPVIEKYLASIK